MAERWLSSLPPIERVEAIDLTIDELRDLRDAAVREMDDLEFARLRRRLDRGAPA